MTPDWSALAPHRPAKLEEGEYVHRGDGLRTALSQLVEANTPVVLVGGPAGVGKSSDLVAARPHLVRWHVLAQLDTMENLRKLTSDRLLLRLAGAAVEFAVKWDALHKTAEIVGRLAAYGVVPNLVEPTTTAGGDAGGRDLAMLALREVTRVVGSRVRFWIDGLEKAPEGEGFRDLLDTLTEVAEIADLIVVVPWHAAYGPQAAEPLIQGGERFVTARAVRVEDAAGIGFLQSLVERRFMVRSGLQLFGTSGFAAAFPNPAAHQAFQAVVTQAAVLSGGLPRTFLQLLTDAAGYARLRGQAWPNDADLAQAATDHRESLRRILLPGDRDRLGSTDGTDGTELETSAKVRFLAHGLLLERVEAGRTVLRMAPLVAQIARGGLHA